MDCLRLIIRGGNNAAQVEAILEADIAAQRELAERSSSALAKVAGSLPAFGIVAAAMALTVNPVVFNGPNPLLGQYIGATLVGAVLGVLLSYGFIGPLAGLLAARAKAAANLLVVVKVCLVAVLYGYDPDMVVDCGRTSISSNERPSVAEMDQYLREKTG